MLLETVRQWRMQENTQNNMKVWYRNHNVKYDFKGTVQREEFGLKLYQFDRCF
jgi:uncharacterized membrane protein